LPDRVPPEKATIAIRFEEVREPEVVPKPEAEVDRHDIEWWEEFDDEVEPVD